MEGERPKGEEAEKAIDKGKLWRALNFMKSEECVSKKPSSTDCLNDLIRIISHLERQVRHRSAARIAGKAMVEGLAHDLRNPLAVIHSCCQFLAEDKRLTRRAKENVQWIGENIDKANKLISQFLSFSRVCLTFQPIDINECIRKEWEMAIRRNGGPKVSFRCQLAEDLPEVFGDDEKIARVFFNLLQNAAEAVSEVSPEAIVTAETRFLPSRNMVEAIIMDNGPGIPEKIRGKIFRPYFTTKKTAKGLGLPITQHFVQQHKGEIDIENRLEGGTKATVRLPVFLSPERP